jgi:MFS family permease
MADRCASRRVPLLLGLVVLIWATVMLCLGSSLAVLIAGRILQGFSAAVIWTVGLALLADTYGQKEIGQAMGFVLLAQSVAILIGPFLGGIVYARAGYYAVFEMAFGLIVLDIVLRLALIERPPAATTCNDSTDTLTDEKANTVHKSEDKKGAEPNVKVNVDEIFPSSPSTTSPTTRTTSPILLLLRSPRLLAALWGSFAQATLMSAFDGVLPLFVSRTFNWTPTGAGLIFFALAAPAFSGPVVGWACDKFGPRWLATVGFAFALPFLVLLRLVTHHSLEQVVLLCALLVLVGTCMTVVMPPLMAEITYAVEAMEREKPGVFGKKGAYAQAYGLFFCAFAGGIFVGPILAGFVEDKAGWGTMAWSLGLLSGLSALPAVVWTGGLITRRGVRGGSEVDEEKAELRSDDTVSNAFKAWVRREVSRLDKELDLNFSWSYTSDSEGVGEERFVTYIV